MTCQFKGCRREATNILVLMTEDDGEFTVQCCKEHSDGE